MSFQQIFNNVHNNSSAIIFLQNANIIHRTRTCDSGHKMTLDQQRGRRRCHLRSCRAEKSVKTNNWIQSAKVKLPTIVHFIYGWAHELTSVEFCKRKFGMSKSTAVDWNNFLREVCVWKLSQGTSKIGGAGCIVEIDESLFVRRINNAGQILPQQRVFCGICCESNECFVVCVPDRLENMLLPIICERIRVGSTIESGRTYNNIQQTGLYTHSTVNHKYNFMDPMSGAYMQNVERIWRSAKWGNKKPRGTKRNFLYSYLSEFMWRSKLNGRNPFNEILKDIAEFWPPA